MNTIDSVVCQEARRGTSGFPNLHSSPALIAASDYSGQHKKSRFDIYSILIVGSESVHPWNDARLHVRRHSRIGRRRLSFKGLSDVRKTETSRCFLHAADLLDGLCVALVVSRDISSLFSQDTPLDLSCPDLAPFQAYKPHVFEKLLRIVHFLSFFVAGVSRPGQDLFWFTDQDDIAANDNRVLQLTQIMASISGRYLSHDPGHLRCGTTQCDDGSLWIEDLAAIPDLVSGALGELFTRYLTDSRIPSSDIIVPAPSSVSVKSREICLWFGHTQSRLKKLALLLRQVGSQGGVQVGAIELHAGEWPAG